MKGMLEVGMADGKFAQGLGWYCHVPVPLGSVCSACKYLIQVGMADGKFVRHVSGYRYVPSPLDLSVRRHPERNEVESKDLLRFGVLMRGYCGRDVAA